MRKVIILSFLLMTCISLSAQSSKDYNPKMPDYSNKSITPTPTAPPPPPNPIPIDGGASVLLAIGVGYGIKKIRDTRKSN